MLRNLSRTGYVFLALSLEQGIVLKPFLVRNRVRVLGSQRHTPTLKFWEYPPSELDEFKRKDWGEEKFGGEGRGMCYFELVHTTPEIELATFYTRNRISAYAQDHQLCKLWPW